MRYLAGVVTLEYDAEKCNGCRLCVTVCPHGVLGFENKKAFLADRDACMECGACAINCPEDAISVRAGVGCASAIIVGKLSKTDPTCDCDSDSSCCC